MVLTRRVESKREGAGIAACPGQEPAEGPVDRPECNASHAWKSSFMLDA